MNIKRLIQILISIVVLVFLFFSIDFSQVKNSLINANFYLLLLAIFMVTANRFLMAYKWNLLLQYKGIKKSLFEITKLYYMSNFLGLFLPPTIGMDTLRTLFLSSGDKPKSDIIATIIIERVIGFICLFIAATVGIIFLLEFLISKNPSTNSLFLILIFLSIFGSLAFIISFNEKLYNLITNYFSKHRENKLISKIFLNIKKFHDSYYSFKDNKLLLFTFGVLTFMEIFSVILWSYTIAIGLGINVSFNYFVVFVPILLVVIRLPISIDGFGLNEGGYVYFLGLVGITSAIAFSVGLINHIIVLIALIPGGIIYSLHKTEVKSKYSTK